jgi:hypothetical protein
VARDRGATTASVGPQTGRRAAVRVVRRETGSVPRPYPSVLCSKPLPRGYACGGRCPGCAALRRRSPRAAPVSRYALGIGRRARGRLAARFRKQMVAEPEPRSSQTPAFGSIVSLCRTFLSPNLSESAVEEMLGQQSAHPAAPSDCICGR